MTVNGEKCLLHTVQLHDLPAGANQTHLDLSVKTSELLT